ncbi:CRISPR-associated RAMP protein, Cmr1 family [Thermovibrio ammonificans HB-1]|uniref:CRISPR-associated RAMP protein, Cmr1 family n=1 Tax=Thermovibrio ammonificans (strain DSM 15698 / JCM 12110 / HB-1) TaxID=648996 RepID=E8T4Q5_THEA1|nr:type III-B CRISPR module RAMP protein Cmr1 [Thermovibrio ammonificans]ADU96317.1 CRISPR-associated RAMP protein, Cmr1 family [Thermovibrio ammonificans HB-1]
MKKEIAVKFNTITPLWTGDAWRENCEIRPSSLIGSLRFWFEVICYFSGICKRKHFSPKLGRFEKEVNRKDFKNCLANKGNSFKDKIKCLLEQDIPYPSIIFGTTNWKSLIEIKEIKYSSGYCFGDKLNLPNRICLNKVNYEIKENGDCPQRSNKTWSVFYFAKPYFYGNFEVIFEVEEEIIELIFYPLLTFMDKYGFWGGKWNIGYGRLEVLEVKENNNNNPINNWRKTDFELFDKTHFSKTHFSWKELVLSCEIGLNSSPHSSILYINKKNFQFNCKKEEVFKENIKNIPERFIIFRLSENSDSSNIYENIKYLLKKKLDIRDCLRHICEEKEQNNKSKFENECFNNRKEFQKNKEIECKGKSYKCEDIMQWKKFRHKLLGERGEGSKILPFIHKENKQLKAGFLSIAGLLNLEGKSDG